MALHPDTQAFIDEINSPTVVNLAALKTELLAFTNTVLTIEEQVAKWSRMGKVAELQEDHQEIDDLIEEGMGLIDGYRHSMANLPTEIRNLRLRYKQLKVWVTAFETQANIILP